MKLFPLVTEACTVSERKYNCKPQLVISEVKQKMLTTIYLYAEAESVVISHRSILRRCYMQLLIFLLIYCAALFSYDCYMSGSARRSMVMVLQHKGCSHACSRTSLSQEAQKRRCQLQGTCLTMTTRQTLQQSMNPAFSDGRVIDSVIATYVCSLIGRI